MEKESLMQEICSNYCINVVFPKNYNKNKKYPAIFLNDGNKMSLWDFSKINCFVFGIEPKNRLAEYSPWKEKALRENVEDFDGECDNYIQTVVKEIIPYLQKKYQLLEDKLVFGGFSLGGLAAIYSLYITNCFQYVFSICGSFWYPGFSIYTERKQVINPEVKLFLLNGKIEGNNHNNILIKAPELAKSVHDCLADEVSDCTCIFDDYGHHDAMNERVNQVVRWLEQHEFETVY